MEYNSEHQEGAVAAEIENETAKLPSDTFLWAAAGSAAFSLGLRLVGCKSASTFVSQWVPTILILGLYNKLVKIGGHDSSDRTESLKK